MSFRSKAKKTKETKKNNAEEIKALPSGLTTTRRFTSKGKDPLKEIKYVKRSSVINNPDGSVVFKMDAVEIPDSWSQLATDIIVSKYFRKRGVPKTGHETSNAHRGL